MKRALLLAILLAIPTQGQTTPCDNAPECMSAIQANPNSSQAHYRLAGIYLAERNFQSAAIEFNAALKGDLQPKWIEIQAHLQLGKIFDRTGQRDRALREYQTVLQIHDDSNGAKDDAARYIASPYTGN